MDRNGIQIDGFTKDVMDQGDLGAKYAAFGWHVYDITVALKDYQDDPGFETYQAALVRGYRRMRNIDDDSLALIPLFLLIRTLNSIGWADARPELGHPEYVPRLASYVDDRAESVLAAFTES